MIYAIQAEGVQAVKFGLTAGETVAKRLIGLQVGCPIKLIVLATARWPDHYERRIHGHLLPQLVRGEWFRLEGDAERIVFAMRNDKDGLRLLHLVIGRDRTQIPSRLSRVLAFADDAKSVIYKDNIPSENR